MSWELAKVADRPDLLTRWCAVAQAQARLTAGDPDAAVGCIRAPSGDDNGFAAAMERVALARAQLALRRPELLTEILAPLLTAGMPYLLPAVEARVLLALAADRLRRDSAALAAITDAITLAEPEGIRRPFLDAGPAAAALIGRHRHVVATQLDFTAELLPTAEPALSPVGMPTLEHLTERELIVLRYLPTMLKAAEIAKVLFVTVNTVKSHQRAIYRKLDATTRRGAVDRARELNLL